MTLTYDLWQSRHHLNPNLNSTKFEVMFLYVIIRYVMLCHIMSHYFCDVVPSYVIVMVYHVILCKTASGRRETNRQGRTKDPSPRFFLSRASLLQRVLSKPIMRAFCLQMGGTAPPRTPRFFKPCGAAPPPKPPDALNFKPCKLASKYISLLFRTLSCDHCVWDVL